MAGNQGNNRVVWEPWQLERLLQMHHDHTAQQLSDAIGIRRTKIREKLYELGIKKLELEYWTNEQVQYLKKNYLEMGDSELAEVFNSKWHKNKGWSKKHIEKKRRYLGLKRDQDTRLAVHKRNVQAGRFADCPVKAWKIRGVTPVGTRKMIENSEGGPVMIIKLKSGFVHYARWLYQQIYGPIPAGCVVRLKDGNAENVVPGNLIVLTRRQNGILNSTNRNPQITQSKRLIQTIKKITKQHEKQTPRPQQSPVQPARKTE